MMTAQRLTELFSPNHYQLTLDIDRVARTFKGVVAIRGTSKGDSRHVVLNAKELAVTSVTVNGQTASYTHENDEIDITHDSLNTGEHEIVVTYDGMITDHMHGMYPCFYQHDGESKELIATQFESHHAREVFPCIDEPAAKATYDLTLVTEHDVTVLGNMPISDQMEEDGRLTTTFERTPRMSSYLLAWVYGELQKKSARTKSGVEVNVWSTPAQPIRSLDFALDIATRSIDFYDEYFGTPYPLPKADHVALPDFSSGAMENWGLITYREMALLVDPMTTSVSMKHYIATVVAHELAHQWFGNLVTMKWWNDLWLNESFATLMEYIAVDALQPDWNVWLDFASNESVMALRRDAMEGVQAVQVDVSHPDEISTLFDSAIVYAKGARLLRMLETYVGKDAFRTGLRRYFELHAYDNTAADDLWEAIAEASGKDIAGFMNAWIAQPGYPVVTLTDDMITQEQFFIGKHEESNRTWPLPLGSSDNAVPELLVDQSISAKLPTSTRLNEADSAHFITRYSPERLQLQLESIQDMSPLARLQLMHEQTLLARGGRITSDQLVPLLQAYTDETVESVWDIMALTFSELKKFVEAEHEAEAKLRTLAKALAEHQFAELGWDVRLGEAETDTKQRATILGMMLYAEHPDVTAEALRRFDASSLESLPGEIRPLIISTAVKLRETPELVDELLNTYRTSSSVDLKADICAGLTSTRSPETALALLERSKDSSLVKTQDAFRWFVYLVRNRYARDASWQWLQDNWQWVRETFGGDKSYDDYPRYAATGLVTREQLAEYERFFGPMKSEPSLTRTISLGIAEIEARVGLIERDGTAVRARLLDLDV